MVELATSFLPATFGIFYKVGALTSSQTKNTQNTSGGTCLNDVIKMAFLAGGYSSGLMVKCVSSTSLTEAAELLSTQSEADTRMLLHAMDFDGE